MADSLTGVVTTITNADSFEMRVEEVSARDPDMYGDTESIHINDGPGYEGTDPYLDTEPFTVRTMEDLEARLKGKAVRCLIKGRDEYGHLLADVTIVGS